MPRHTLAEIEYAYRSCSGPGSSHCPWMCRTGTCYPGFMLSWAAWSGHCGCIAGCNERAALNLRVSTLDQHPETQVYDLRQMASQRGWQIIEEYTDRVSG